MVFDVSSNVRNRIAFLSAFAIESGLSNGCWWYPKCLLSNTIVINTVLDEYTFSCNGSYDTVLSIRFTRLFIHEVVK